MKIVVTNKLGDTGVFPFFMCDGFARFEDDAYDALDRFVDGTSCSTAEIILCWINEGKEMSAVDEEFSYVVQVNGKPCTSEQFYELPLST